MISVTHGIQIEEPIEPDPVVPVQDDVHQYNFWIPFHEKRHVKTSRSILPTDGSWALGSKTQFRIIRLFHKTLRRKFKDNNVSIRIFEAVIDQLISNGVIDPSVLFIDGTHVKANANNKHKDVSREVQAAAKRCKKLLDEDVARDREEHGKKALKEKKKSSS